MIIKLNKKLKSKKAQSTTEYLILIGALVAMIMIFGNTIKERIGKFTGNIFEKIEQKSDENFGG